MLRASLFNLPNKKQEAATEKLFSDSDREEEISHSLKSWHLEAWQEWSWWKPGSKPEAAQFVFLPGSVLLRV